MAAPLHRDLVEGTPPVWPAAPRVLWRVALGRRRASAGRLLCRQDLLHGLREQGLQSPGGVEGGICGPAVGPAAAAARAAGAQRAPCGVGLAYVPGYVVVCIPVLRAGWTLSAPTAGWRFWM